MTTPLTIASTIYIVVMGITTVTTSVFYIWNLDGMDDPQYILSLDCHPDMHTFGEVIEEPLEMDQKNMLSDEPHPACESKRVWNIYAVFCLVAGLSYFFFLLIRCRDCSWEVPETAGVDLNRINFFSLAWRECGWACQALCSNCGFYVAVFFSFVGMISTTAVAVFFFWLAIDYPQEFKVRGETIRPLTVILFMLSPIHFIQLLVVLGHCCCGFGKKKNLDNPTANLEETEHGVELAQKP